MKRFAKRTDKPLQVLILIAFSVVVGCQTKPSTETSRAPEPPGGFATPGLPVLKTAHGSSDFIVISADQATQVVPIMRGYLKPLLYKEVPSPSVSSSACQYTYPPTSSASDGLTCTALIPPTCFRLVETIRKSLLSKKTIDMETLICAGRSLVKDALLLEIVYGEEMKWSGSNISVNARKEFHGLKQVLTQQLGDNKVSFVQPSDK